MKPVVIVGAGITGCIIAYELAQKGTKVILVEKEASIGGLARTFRYGEFKFDIGPHRFYADKKNITEYIRKILGNHFEVISRDSRVYFLGRYYNWPLRPKILCGLPMSILLKAGTELLSLIVENHKAAANDFKEYILCNYGRTLYDIFFKDYTRKFLGLEPDEVHANWAQEAIKRTIIDEHIVSRNLFDLVQLTFMFKSLRTNFIYPKEGIDNFCRRLAEAAEGFGCKVVLNSSIDKIKCSADKIEEIYLNGDIINPAQVIWTGGIDQICQQLGISSGNLEYLALIVYNIEMRKRIKKNYQWCYYGSKEILFNRITIPSRFNKNMVPEGRDGLCVEITCRENDSSWNNPDLLVGRIKEDLVKVGIIEKSQDIAVIHIEKIPNAYPVYSKDYLQNLEAVQEDLAAIKNLTLAGRTGLFWYNNMDDSIENGLKVAKAIGIIKEGLFV